MGVHQQIRINWCPDREQTSLGQQECRRLAVRWTAADADVDLTLTTGLRFSRSSVMTTCWTLSSWKQRRHTRRYSTKSHRLKQDVRKRKPEYRSLHCVTTGHDLQSPRPSAVYMMNSLGPNTDPRSTPHISSTTVDLASPHRMYCERPRKYYWNHWRTTSLILKDIRRRCNRILWSAVSKAAVKSRRIKAAKSPHP